MSTMMPDMISELDVETFVRMLADEPDVECTTEGCDEPARWRMQCGWCASPVHVGDQCRSVIDHAQHHRRVVRCKIIRGGRKCGWEFPSPLPWRAL